MSRKADSRHPSHQLYDVLGRLLSHIATPPTTYDTIEISAESVPCVTPTNGADERRASSARVAESLEIPCDKPQKKVIETVSAEAINRPHLTNQLTAG
jgi:hypothetical protein